MSIFICIYVTVLYRLSKTGGLSAGHASASQPQGGGGGRGYIQLEPLINASEQRC